MISFGPAIYHEPDGTFRASCTSCRFRVDATCTYTRQERRIIPDVSNTPAWCEMREGMLRDAADMANGVTHRVARWSGRKTDEPREVFRGIPSDAAHRFRAIVSQARRGAVILLDGDREIERHDC